jgi:hypothetical protein
MLCAMFTIVRQNNIGRRHDHLLLMSMLVQNKNLGNADCNVNVNKK